MLRKIFFCKNWGGAKMLLFSSIFIFLTWLPLNVKAQACNDWEIEICNQAKPPSVVDPSCTNPFPYNPCNTVYYYIYLAKSGNANNINLPFQFNFYEFNLSGSSIVTPSPITSRITSKPNEGVSLMCSPNGLNDPNIPSSPLYKVEENNQKFSYKVIDSGALVNWTVFGRRLLCVLAVNVYPGEIIELGQLSASVKFSNGNICNLSISGCDGGPIPSYQVLPPSNTCVGTGFQLRQGTAQNDPVPGYPNRKKIPVFVFSQPNEIYNIQRLDFLMKVEAPALMAGISLEAGLFPANELELYNETTGPITNKRIFADYRFVSINATNTATPENTLFYIILDGPQLSSDCGSTTVTFTGNRRLLLGPSGSCCLPSVVGDPQLVEWNTAPCPVLCSNFEVKAKTASSIPPGVDPCHSVFFDVDMLSSASKKYTEGRIQIEVKYSGTLTWSPTLSSSAYCSTMSSCVSVVQIAPGLLGLTFDIDGSTLIDLTATNPQNLIRFGFVATNACIEAVTFRNAIFTEQNATIPCLPTTVSQINGTVLADDICITSLTMTYELHFGPLMEEVGYRVGDDDPTSPTDPITCEMSGQGSSLTNGSVAICACYLPNQPQWVYPAKVDNPLNGVTTYDLVLISKHILGIEPFDSPYKMTAADVNNSGSITTFDIVELRKLILGIYGPQLPPTPPNPWPYNSYKFVDKTILLPPFPLTPLSQTVQVTVPPLGAIAAFKGIKMGDVNNTALGASLLLMDERNTTTIPLGFLPSGGKKGDRVSIPVFIQDSLDYNSWQIAIHYNPLQWKLTNVVWASQMGEMPEQYWSETSSGHIRLLGYNAIGGLVHLPIGVPLFYLEGELLQDTSAITLGLDDKIVDFLSESYRMNGDKGSFVLRAANETEMVVSPPNSMPNKVAWSAEIYPNPAGKAFRIHIKAPEDGIGSIRFFNTLGQLVAEDIQGFVKGENIITSANLPVLQSGIYVVEINASWGQKSLRLVKN
jgi:hypothetical protein